MKRSFRTFPWLSTPNSRLRLPRSSHPTKRGFYHDAHHQDQRKSVRTDDNKLHEIDALVCATGFHTSAPPLFPLIGLEGVSLQKKWAERATSYLSLAVDQYPNLFTIMGPNSAIGSGSLTMMIENVGDYIVTCVRKTQKENIRSMVIKKKAVDDFTDYADAYFANTVLRKSARVGIGGKIRRKWWGYGRAVRFIVSKRYEVHGGRISSMNMWERTREGKSANRMG